jgi:hypothetical protein
VSIETQKQTWWNFPSESTPDDAFLVRFGGDGFGSKIVIGREAANKAFALLHAEDEEDDMYKTLLEYAQNNDNWTMQDGLVIDLDSPCDECGWAAINRITFP